jgi:truncated hemoglobin YjbI
MVIIEACKLSSTRRVEWTDCTVLPVPGIVGWWPTTWSAMPSTTASTHSMSSDSPLTGPSAYSDSYGDETTVVKMHSGNGEHDEMDRRAIACFDQALADVGLADALRQVLHDYFAWATTTTMSRYHHSADDVPNGLSIPHWSWDGLQE